jgi:hypothetical protein
MYSQLVCKLTLLCIPGEADLSEITARLGCRHQIPYATIKFTTVSAPQKLASQSEVIGPGLRLVKDNADMPAREALKKHGHDQKLLDLFQKGQALRLRSFQEEVATLLWRQNRHKGEEKQTAKKLERSSCVAAEVELLEELKEPCHRSSG